MNRDGMVALMLAAVTLLFSLDVAADTKPLPIRIGWVVVPQTLEPIYFEKPGIARHLGSSYVMEPVHFAGSTPEITALAANELDIAPFVFSSLAFAVKNAGLDDLRIICDEVQDGVEGYYSNEYMVLKDGPIRTAEDLKGKVLAPNVLGGLADMGIRAFMQKHGMEANRDYSLVEVNFPNMKAELLDRKVDLISAVGPFSHDAVLRDKARTLFTQRDAFGTTQLSALVARAGFIQKNRAALVDFLEDVLRSIRWYTDPANHADAVAIISHFYNAQPQMFDSWVFTRDDYYRDPNGIPNLAATQQNLITAKNLGFIKADLEVARYADLSLIQEAAQRLH